MNMKFKTLLLTLLITNLTFCQNEKEIALENDIVGLVEEMEFMYGYDQTLREYTIFKTFDKSETDRIENLSDSLRLGEISKRKFKSDSIGKFIWENYIIPKDAKHTERMIEITKKYGFPSVKRIRQFYFDEFADPEFNPLLLLIHSPSDYSDELKTLMMNEYKIGNINQCQYGYLLWHLEGRKSMQPMLDNGFKMDEENGMITMKSTCK